MLSESCDKSNLRSIVCSSGFGTLRLTTRAFPTETGWVGPMGGLACAVKCFQVMASDGKVQLCLPSYVHMMALLLYPPPSQPAGAHAPHRGCSAYLAQGIPQATLDG